MRRVAYYAHHHGSGHLRHAANMARNPDVTMLVLTSGDTHAVSLPANVEVVHLTPDLTPGHAQPEYSSFHWTPHGAGAANVQRRFSEIHRALDEFGPDVVISDVSVEVVLFAHLCGYPTISRRMHGDRDDAAHQLMYATSDALLAYFPQALDRNLPASLGTRTVYAGMSKPDVTADSVEVRNRSVGVLTGLGGEGFDIADVNFAASRTPEWHWQVLGIVGGNDVPVSNVEIMGVVEDPAATLASAEVIVTSTGHNALRATAAAGRPALLSPEPRPFDEQLRAAEAIAACTDASLIESWEADWSATLHDAAHQDPNSLANALFVDESTFHEACNEAFALASAE